MIVDCSFQLNFGTRDGPSCWVRVLIEAEEPSNADPYGHAVDSAMNALRPFLNNSTYFGEWEPMIVGVNGAQVPSYVYVLEAGGRVKIGRTTDVVARVRALQIGCPHRIRVLAVVPGGAAREAQLHNEFRRYRVHGEWFELPTPTLIELERRLTAEMLDILAARYRGPRRPSWRRRLWRRTT